MNAHLYDSDWDYYDSIGEEQRRKEQQAEHDADFADCYENDRDDPNNPW